MKRYPIVQLLIPILATVMVCAFGGEPANNAKIFSDRGAESFNRGEWKEAVEALNKAIDLDPKNSGAYLYRGGAKLKLGDTEGAKADFLKAFTLNPKLKEDLGPSSSPPEKDSIEEYTRVIEKNPKDQKAYVGRGLEKAQRGDAKGAIKDFTKAIELNPADARAYFYRGVTRTGSGDFKNGIADLDQTIKLDPQNADAFQTRGEVKKQQKDLKGAMADFQKAIALNSKLKEEIQPSLVECQKALSEKDNAGRKK